jgi:hypothetical protein
VIRSAFMSFMRSSIVFLSLITGLFAVSHGEAGDCQALHTELGRLEARLDDYLRALDQARIEQDSYLASALRYQISRLRTEISDSRDAIKACEKVRPTDLVTLLPLRGGGLYVDKSCTDLRNMMIPLMRRVNSLSRMEKSAISRMTDSERVDLDKARRELAEVKAVFHTHCEAPPPRVPARGPKNQRPKSPTYGN